MSILKKIIISFAAMAGIALVLVGGSYLTTGRRLDADSKAAAQAVFSQLAAKWSYEEVVRLSDERLLKSAPRSQLQELLAGFKKKLGPLVSIESCEGAAKVFFNLGDFSRSTSAEYHIKAKFAKGQGEAFLRLGKNEEGWRLLMLNLQSPLMLK